MEPSNLAEAIAILKQLTPSNQAYLMALTHVAEIAEGNLGKSQQQSPQAGSLIPECK